MIIVNVIGMILVIKIVLTADKQPLAEYISLSTGHANERQLTKGLLIAFVLLSLSLSADYVTRI